MQASPLFGSLALALLVSACAGSSQNCDAGTALCACLDGLCLPGLSCIDNVCVTPGDTTGDQESTGADDSASSTGQSGESGSNDSSDSGMSGDCDVPPPAAPADPPASCLPNVPCTNDGNCPDGHVCNLELSPPACELLYCGEAGTPCHDTSICAPGLQCHEGRCNPCDICGDLCAVDLMTDPVHCGCCFNPIPDGGICNEGEASCMDGHTLCGDACVDLETSLTDCGSCGNALPAEQSCVDGVPTCEYSYESVCPDGCADLESDSDNCVRCGHACPEDSTCFIYGCATRVTSEERISCTDICEAEGGWQCATSAAVYNPCNTALYIDCDEVAAETEFIDACLGAFDYMACNCWVE